MAIRPRKPWRVTITTPDGPISTEHTSENKTFEHVRTELRAGNGTRARVEQWEGGRWWHFETVNAEEII